MTKPSPRDPESVEDNDAMTGRAWLSARRSPVKVCGTIIYIVVVGGFGVCHADCHEEDCGKATYYLAGSGGMCARLFP